MIYCCSFGKRTIKFYYLFLVCKKRFKLRYGFIGNTIGFIFLENFMRNGVHVFAISEKFLVFSFCSKLPEMISNSCKTASVTDFLKNKTDFG